MAALTESLPDDSSESHSHPFSLRPNKQEAVVTGSAALAQPKSVQRMRRACRNID
jgi:hypothetical protein